MTFDRNNALCYGQGFFSPNLVAIEQKNKTKQNKQTLLQGYHHFHWNRELHEFPKSSPPPPPATILTLHRKYAFPELFHCTTLSYKFFAIHKSPHLLWKKSIPPNFITHLLFKTKQQQQQKYLPKPLYLVPIYSLISHLQPFTSNIHTKVKVIYVLLALLPTTLHNMRRKKNPFFYSYYPPLCGLTGQ